jgi:hypothetical protein
VRKLVVEDGEEHLAGGGRKPWGSQRWLRGEVMGLRRLSPFLSNPNQATINKNIKIAELSRKTHLVQMTTHASFFSDQENNKHFQP